MRRFHQIRWTSFSIRHHDRFVIESRRSSIVGRTECLARRPRLLHERGLCPPKPPAYDLDYHGTHTIFALSTAPGRAAIAIVRVSGPACERVHALLCPGKALPKPRQATLRTLLAPRGARQDILDPGALVLYFPAPNTTTGEDVLELHLHGSPAIVRAVLSAVGRCSTNSFTVRPAEPGEFTRRAFINDRLTLPEVEALGDTLAAVTEEQRRVSVQSTSRNLADRYESWRKMLLEARGELEALIDFSEDQHFDESPSELAAGVAQQVKQLISTIETHEQNAMRGELLRSGIALSLIGQPNVGKSSLLNQIVGRDAAIVSREAGTTRDVIEVGIDLGGFFCRLGDTAGLRAPGVADVSSASTVGEVEREGIRRAKAQALRSDVVVVVLAVEPSLDGQGVQLQLDNEVLATAREVLQTGKRVVVAINKLDRYDLRDDAPELAALEAHLAHDLSRALPGIGESDVFCVSVQRALARSPETRASGGGGDARLARLLDGLVRTFRDLTSPLRCDRPAAPEAGQDDPAAVAAAAASARGLSGGDADAVGLGATARQRGLLEQSVRELRRFLDLVEQAPASPSGRVDHEEELDIVVAAERLRAAAECLAKITGRGEGAGDVEEVLGVVFEK